MQAITFSLSSIDIHTKQTLEHLLDSQSKFVSITMNGRLPLTICKFLNACSKNAMKLQLLLDTSQIIVQKKSFWLYWLFKYLPMQSLKESVSTSPQTQWRYSKIQDIANYSVETTWGATKEAGNHSQ